jgi:hypothetical protein
MNEPDNPFWTIEVTVQIPRDEAPGLDEAIDMVGEKLRPLAWAGSIHEDPGHRVS